MRTKTTKILTYWIADNLVDAAVYSVRAKTRIGALAILATNGHAKDFAEPREVSMQYTDAFDLMLQLMQEGGAE